VTFTDLSSGPITKRFWSFGDGSTSNTTATTIVKTYNAPGAKTVALTVNGPGGSNTLVQPGYISVAPAPPQASFSGAPTSGVAPLAVTFTDNSTGTITNWFWDFGDGTTLTTLDSIVVKTYSTPGTNAVVLAVSGPLGTSTSLRTNYIIVAAAPPSVDVQPIAQAKTLGGVAAFSVAASGSLPLSYQWLKNGIAIANATNMSLTLSNLQFSDAGIYSVAINNVAGSTNSADAGLVVNMPQAGDSLRSFSSGLTLDGPIYATALQPDGKILIGGSFGVARLNADGNLDTSFSRFFGRVFCLALQPDGKVVVGGQFWSTAHGTNRYNIARCLPDGSLDPGFQGTVDSWVGVDSLAVQPDGKIIFGGDYQIGRLNTDGSVDSSFQTGGSLNGAFDVVRALILQTDGKVLIGGDFSAFNGVTRNHIARLTSTGLLDTSFMDNLSGADGSVQSLALQSDGRVLMGGGFDVVNGVARNHIARLNQDGSLDQSFQNTMSGADDWVRTLALQSDGRLLIGGYFTTVDGLIRNRLARLNPDGGLDEAFQQGMSGADNSVNSLALQTNGDVIVAGEFTSFNGEPRSRIATVYGSAPVFPPTLITQPQSQSVDWGSDVLLSVAASGSPPLQYQWRKNGASLAQGGGNIGGAMTPLLLVANAQEPDAAAYDVVIANSSGSVTSSVANLMVMSEPHVQLGPPAGTPNTFNINASGTPRSVWWVLRAPELTGPWMVMGTVGVGTNGIGSFTDPSPPPNRAFYRVASLLSGPPVISAQPEGRTNIQGTPATFSVISSGTNPLNYQWRKNASPIPDSTNASYSIAAVQPADAANYDVVLTNPYGVVTSTEAALAVVAPPLIASQPQSRTNLQGTAAMFTVAAPGTPPLAYRWRKYGVALTDGGDISGSTNSVLALANVQPGDAGSYDVLVTNAYGSVTSAPAVLTVVFSPTISSQPQSRTNIAGSTAVFTVLASGTPPLAYRWRKDGAALADMGNISGATGRTLTLSNVQVGDSGSYDVVIANSYGAVTSLLAILTVPAPPGIIWQADFGGTNNDTLVAAVPTRDGGFMLGGYTYSAGASGNKTNIFASTPPDWWVVKTDGNGNKQWERTFGGNAVDSLNAIAQATNGDYFLAGYSSSPASGNKTVGTRGLLDYWLMRMDANGNSLWQTNFGGSADDYCDTMVATRDGGCILGGYSYSPVSGNKSATNWGASDYWLVKVDASGHKQWDKSYGGTKNEYLGDHSVQQTTDGGYIVAGSSASDATGNKGIQGFGGLDFWVLKLDTNGNKVAENVFGGSGDDEPNAVRQTVDGGFIVLGYSKPTTGFGTKYSTNYGGKDVWVVKLDNGQFGILNQLWERDYGGNNDDYGGDTLQTSDGGFLVGATTLSSATGNMTSTNHGSQSQDFWLLKLDASGSKVWESTYGGSSNDELVVVQALTNNAILLAGRSQSLTNGNKTVPGYGDRDYWILKLASDTPVIIIGPQGRTNYTGTMATFSVTASGTQPLSYRWRRDGANLIEGGSISGTTNATLTITNVQFTEAGTYDVLVTNPYGVMPSWPALLTVLPPPPPSITSVSWVGGGLRITGTSRTPGRSYYVLASTNLTLPVSQWTPVATNVFDGSGNFGFTNTVSQSAPHRYFLLQLP
jgi:uncharacterized delta-60 repeat protein